MDGRLPAAVVAVVAGRRRPGGQNGEGLLAWPTSPTPDPDPIVLAVVSLFAPEAVADDRVEAADRTPARQLRQADLNGSYPGSALSSVAGNAIKRITAGVKARRWSHCQVSIRRPAFTLLHAPVSNEKGMSASGLGASRAHTSKLAG